MPETKHSPDGAYGLRTPEDSVRYYRDWAADYDRDFSRITSTGTTSGSPRSSARPVEAVPGRIACALAALLAGIYTGAAAADCGIALPPDARPVALDALPEGMVTGRAECDGVARPMGVWTLRVDPGARDLGIRDRPLFRSRPANPLVRVASAEVAEAGRLTVFRRREAHGRGAAGEPDRRAPHRLFGTFCDLGANDPLDCSAGPARVKMRADVLDSDFDGVLDRVRHQVSIWDGGERLQVLMFETAHAGRPLANAVPWIEALALAGRM